MAAIDWARFGWGVVTELASWLRTSARLRPPPREDREEELWDKERAP